MSVASVRRVTAGAKKERLGPLGLVLAHLHKVFEDARLCHSCRLQA